MAAALPMLGIMGDSVPIADRVAAVAPIINAKIDEWGSAACTVGVQTFQDELLQIMAHASLSEERWVDTDKVGVHPDNRAKTGLLPIDVHDLLLFIVRQGWDWASCNRSLGCEVPPTNEGTMWRAWNERLVDGAGGLLAKFTNPERIELLTVRGSHTTAAVRCYKLGSNGVHPELCTDGRISRSKILEMQPSMQEP